MPNNNNNRNLPLPPGLDEFIQALRNSPMGDANGQLRSRQLYPTPEEIMQGEVKHKPAVLALTREWKKHVWRSVKHDSAEARFLAISTLLSRIANEVYRKQVEVVYQADASSCFYSPDHNRIAINHSLSIISSLHELGHHLFGASELKACRWSVWLFKKTFPKAFDRLEWRGHTLIKARACSAL